jgi:hypothetical protein
MDNICNNDLNFSQTFLLVLHVDEQGGIAGIIVQQNKFPDSEPVKNKLPDSKLVENKLPDSKPVSSATSLGIYCLSI